MSSKKPEQDLSVRGHCGVAKAGPSRIHGQGLVATESIVKGVVVAEYVGEVIDNKEAGRRMEEGNTFIVTISSRRSIDGATEHNAARLMNHCCSPNCEVFVDRGRAFVETCREVMKGEELTFDYGYSFNPEDVMDSPCNCNTRGCPGYIIREEDRAEANKWAEKEVTRVLKEIRRDYGI